jgi:hypothetical protein
MSPAAGGGDMGGERGPKGADDGGAPELTEGGGGEWRGGGSPIGRCEHEVGEREEGGDGVLGRALTREDERGKKGGRRGALYRRRRGEWGWHGGRAARCGRQRPSWAARA